MKGAVVLDTLARTLGEENFPKIMRQIATAVDNRAISTADFLSLIERITGAELDSFGEQFIYGSGLPEFYYGYRLESRGPGKWVVKGEARQQAPYRFRYRAVKTAAGRLDVAREKLDQAQIGTAALVVPLDIAVFDRSRKPSSKQDEEIGNVWLRHNLVLQGERTSFAIDVDHEPKGVWLDRNKEVFGVFFSETRDSKHVLLLQGLDAAASGKGDEAEALFARASAVKIEAASDAEGTLDRSAARTADRRLDALIDLSRARLYLDEEKYAFAQAAFDRAYPELAQFAGPIKEELQILESRLDLSRGDDEKAFKRLRNGLLRRGDLDDAEGYVLLAIAAKATSHREEFDEAVKLARENGADLALAMGE
jgi:tetratricopeptide (TPR) repeat protein